MKTVRLYFAEPGGDSLVVETRELTQPPGAHAMAAVLVAELDRGPRAGGVAALPAGTSVLNVYSDERGTLTLDLSRAFLQGFRGGAAAEYMAIASLVRTLGANMPEVQRVQIVCGGAPLVTLGGHVPLDRPLEVAEWGSDRAF
jgi:spore germination protein GerM